MLELCFYAEKRSLDKNDLSFQRWQTVCSAFGVDRCYIIDNTKFARVDVVNKAVVLPCPSVIVGGMEDIPLPLTPVFVERDVPKNRTAIPYNMFEHPKDAIYCFGGDACGMQYAWHEQDTQLPGHFIEVPTDSSIWADQAAAIVLAHRKVTHANHRQ